MPDQRARPDRRRRPTRALSRYWLTGRRRGGRRAGERADVYVDRYRPGELAAVAALLALGAADLLLTLQNLAHGIGEANPLLAWTLAAGGTPAFVAVKGGVTIAVAAFLCLHLRFRWTRALLPVALVVYCGVLAAHAAVLVA